MRLRINTNPIVKMALFPTRRYKLLLLACFLSLVQTIPCIPVHAQFLWSEEPDHATTYDWSMVNRLQLMDRSHAFGDIFYDRGFGRVYTPDVKREYELDLLTQEFSFEDSFKWYADRNGLRSRFGSYTKSTWAVLTELHPEIELTSKSSIVLHTYLHQDPRANRALFEFEFRKQINDRSTFSIRQTLAEFKKDLDLSLNYSIATESAGRFSFDLVLQNYLNNLVNVAGNDENLPSALQSRIETTYRTFPLLLFFRYTTPENEWFYADLSGGWQPQLRSDLTEITEEDFNISQTEDLYYLNGSVDLRFNKTVLGVYGYTEFTRLERDDGGTSIPFPGRYTTRQQLFKFGFFGYGTYGRFRPEFRISRERYTDRQSGTNFDLSTIPEAFDYDEWRWLLNAGISYKAGSLPLVFSGNYQYLTRDLDREASTLITRQWTNQYIWTVGEDQRVTFKITYRPHPKVYIQVGAAYDIDGDITDNPSFQPVRKSFDKGFGKFLVRF